MGFRDRVSCTVRAARGKTRAIACLVKDVGNDQGLILPRSGRARFGTRPRSATHRQRTHQATTSDRAIITPPRQEAAGQREPGSYHTPFQRLSARSICAPFRCPRGLLTLRGRHCLALRGRHCLAHPGARCPASCCRVRVPRPRRSPCPSFCRGRTAARPILSHPRTRRRDPPQGAICSGLGRHQGIVRAIRRGNAGARMNALDRLTKQGRDGEDLQL